jgi:beta-glucosidase
VHPPCVRDPARAVVVGRHVLLAHGAMYRAVRQVLPATVPVGVVHQMPFIEALDPEQPAHVAAAAAVDRFVNQIYLDGVTTGVVAPPFGDGRIDDRLPDSFDVIGLNYYARTLVRPNPDGPFPDVWGLRRRGEPPAFDDEMGWEVHPAGLGMQLRRLAALGKPIYVTENGAATLDDEARIAHLKAHLAEVHGAIADGADVRGFFYWSLIDNFEWAEGWSKHFGLIAVDRETLERRPRSAALAYRDIITANRLVD